MGSDVRVAFRADASFDIGTGHVMRCLTLAGRLRDKGAQVSFVCRELPGALCGFVEGRGFEVFRLPYADGGFAPSGSDMAHAAWLGTGWEKDAEETAASLRGAGGVDWLVADHYALDSRWEKRLRSSADRLMVIDDIADRAHDCDILLDQNLYEGMELRYQGLVPDGCAMLLGPKYALLRPEFVEARKTLRRRDGSVGRIMVFFGGSDLTDETSKALVAIKSLARPDIAVDVVTGSSNARREHVRVLCGSMPNCEYHCQVDNMAELMARADLAVGAGGTTTWERCCTGLPTLVVAVAQNQVEIARDCGDADALFYMGSWDEVDAEAMTGKLRELLDDPGRLTRVGGKAAAIVDGQGADRAADIILKRPVAV